jgi:hypothetical protein
VTNQDLIAAMTAMKEISDRNGGMPVVHDPQANTFKLAPVRIRRRPRPAATNPPPAATRAAPRERRDRTRASSRSGDSGDDPPPPPSRRLDGRRDIERWVAERRRALRTLRAPGFRTAGDAALDCLGQLEIEGVDR